jgi:hypothetical protein
MQRRLPIERPIDRLAIDVSDSQLVIATQSHAWLFDTPGPAASR